MRKLAAALVAALLLAVPGWAVPAWAQKTPVFQSGQMVPGDLSKFVTSGVIETVGDLSGDALGVGANPFSVYDRKGLGTCFRSGAASAAHNALCFGHDASENGLITLDSLNGLEDKALLCRVNGVTVPCFGAGDGSVVSVGLSSPGGIFSISGTNPITTAGTFGYALTGSSGGIPYFSSASVLSSSAALTANLPVFGGGAGASPTVGTRSGNTTQVVTTTGTQTSGRCVEIDASGNHIAAAAACGSGGGSGSVTSVGLSVPATSILGVTGSPVTSTGTLGLTTTGTSGGVPYFFSGSVLKTSAALTANLPVIGGGAGAAPAVGTRTGNTTQFATSTGSKTTNNLAKWDADGNIVDAGISSVGAGGGEIPLAIGWISGNNPNKAIIANIRQASTVTAIVGNVDDAVGAAATVSVYKTASGSSCASGTVLHSGSFNANGTADTNQTLTVTTTALSAGDKICLVSTGTGWTAGNGIGGITVFVTTP